MGTDLFFKDVNSSKKEIKTLSESDIDTLNSVVKYIDAIASVSGADVTDGKITFGAPFLTTPTITYPSDKTDDINPYAGLIKFTNIESLVKSVDIVSVAVELDYESGDFSKPIGVYITRNIEQFSLPISLEQETEYKVRVRSLTQFKDIYSDYSQIIHFKTNLTTSFVNTPEIISPSNNGEFILYSGLTIETSDFLTTYEDDEHLSTSYYIYKDDKLIFSNIDDEKNLTSFKISPEILINELGLKINDKISVQIKYKGKKIGESALSMMVEIHAVLPKPLSNGAIIYRHFNSDGCTIEYDAFGKHTKLFVADAKFRASLAFGTYNTDSTLTNFNQSESSSSWYISSNQRNQTDNPPALTITQLESMWKTGNPSLKNDKTARENCDVWMKFEGVYDSQNVLGVPAVVHCRNLIDIPQIDGGCDLPNIFELMVIFLCMNEIDALDPTVQKYPQFALGNLRGLSSKRWYFNNSNLAWSSTDFSSTQVRSLTYQGYAYMTTKQTVCGVCPIRELS